MSTDNQVAAPTVRVRPARLDDLESLHDLDGRVFGELAYPYFTLRQMFDAVPECWLVAAGPGGVVGYSFSVPSTDHSHAWVLGLAVDPNHRNLGYGTALTWEALNMLAGLGVETVYLTVEPENHQAIRLYRAFGFTTAGHRENYFGAGEDRWVMTRRLRGIPTPRPGQT